MKTWIMVLAMTIAVCTSVHAANVDKQLVAGAGPSTVIVQSFMTEFAKLPAAQGYEFTVPPRSAKHAGGIKCSDSNLFGRTGRPLTEEEKQGNKSEIFLARIPIAFAVGADAGVDSITLEDLEGIFSGRIDNWRQVGGPEAPIEVLGREPTEALFMVLKADYPFFRNAQFNKTFKKDNQILAFLKSPKGGHAIGFGAAPNFTEIPIIAVEGFSSGVSVGLVFDQKNKDHPVVRAAISFSRSSEWAERVKATGSLPPL